jgi:hypothetical protein
MAALSEVVFLRPRPGKLDAFISDVTRARLADRRECESPAANG